MSKALVDNVTGMLIEAWQKHQALRPFDPDPKTLGCPPEYVVLQMDQWMKEDMSYWNIVGNRLAMNALHASTEGGDDA